MIAVPLAAMKDLHFGKKFTARASQKCSVLVFWHFYHGCPVQSNEEYINTWPLYSDNSRHHFRTKSVGSACLYVWSNILNLTERGKKQKKNYSLDFKDRFKSLAQTEENGFCWLSFFKIRREYLKETGPMGCEAVKKAITTQM